MLITFTLIPKQNEKHEVVNEASEIISDLGQMTRSSNHFQQLSSIN